MIYSKGLEADIKGKTALSIGKFDGLHLGHQKLLKEVLMRKSQGLEAVVFTFGTSPRAVLSGEHQKALITNDERKELLEHMGIDYLIECPFTKDIYSLEPEQFIKDILIDKLQMEYLVVGPDFRFGYKKRGDIELLRAFSVKYNFQIEVIDKKQFCGSDISSTYIKEELLKGNIEDVNKMLGYPYMITGEVLHGRKLGRTMGMPTTNLIPRRDKILPPNGVYLSVSEVAGKDYPGVTNIGYKPSVGAEKECGVETYMYHFHEQIYGEEIKVKLYTFKRAEQKFASVDALKEQVQKDIAFGKKYFRESKRIYK